MAELWSEYNCFGDMEQWEYLDWRDDAYEYAESMWEAFERYGGHFFAISNRRKPIEILYQNSTASNFAQNVFFRYRNPTSVKIYKGEPNQGYLDISLAVYNGGFVDETIYPALFTIKDLKTGNFVTKKRINNREWSGAYFYKGLAYWNELVEAENAIEELFRKDREYDIYLMNTDYVVAGVSYL